MVYSYAYTFCRRAVVATMDLSATGLHLLRTDHWLRDKRNVLQLWLETTPWEGTAQQDGPTPASPEELAGQWSVSDTVRFLQSMDLEGPAELCRMSGVNGADLLGFNTVDEMVQELRCTPFAAKKMLRARNEFLGR